MKTPAQLKRLAAIAMLTAFSAPPTQAALPLPVGTVAYWSFDDPGNLGKDAGPNGYDLNKVNGTPVYDASGQFGGALDLGSVDSSGAGGSLLTTNGFPALLPTGSSSYTVALWEKSRGQSITT